MGSHHPELEQMGALLPGDSTQELHEESREPCVNERGPVAGSPDDVAVEAVKHTGELMRSVRAFSISSLQGESIKRAVAEVARSRAGPSRGLSRARDRNAWLVRCASKLAARRCPQAGASAASAGLPSRGLSRAHDRNAWLVRCASKLAARRCPQAGVLCRFSGRCRAAA